MKLITWNIEKAELLRQTVGRNGVGFEECVKAINENRIIDDIPNPNPFHLAQRIMIINVDNYAYCVPYVIEDEGLFLKTVYPSRKYTAIYLKKRE